MGIYSITDLEKLSGIKSHTIRIWEQRYKLLSPHRTSTNIRYYDDDQLRKLVNVTALLNKGYKVSRISRLSDHEMYSLLDELEKNKDKNENNEELFIGRLVTAGMEFNELQFEKIFSTCVLRYGLEGSYIKIIYPLLKRLGMMWSTEQANPAQEHFITNIIRQKLFTAIDGLAPIEKYYCSFVLFLPEDEDHEIGLLLTNYLFRIHSIKVVYLGQRVPIANLKETVTRLNPTHIMTFLVHSKPLEEAQSYINELALAFEKVIIAVSGNERFGNKLIMPNNAKWIFSIDQLYKEFIKY